MWTRLLALLLMAGCTKGPTDPFYLFSEISFVERWVPGSEVCHCDIPSSGRFDLRVSYTGSHLVGRVEISPDAIMHRACLIPGPQISIQRVSWGTLKSCTAGYLDGFVAIQVPDMQAREKSHFEFAFRGKPRQPSHGGVAFVAPLLFTLDCPSACRTRAVRWPVHVFLASPPDMVVDVATQEKVTQLSWWEPYPRLALLFRMPSYTPIRFDVSSSTFEGFAEEQDSKRVLNRLHAFTQISGVVSGRKVVFDSHVDEPWGIHSWRFMKGEDIDEVEAEVSASMPVWTHAPLYARRGAVTACALLRLTPDQRNRKLATLHRIYLEWVQQRAADRSKSLAAPAAYWTLLFTGVLQTSPEGLRWQDCSQLITQEPVVSFHEILAKLNGRVPRSVLRIPSIPSVRIAGIVPRGTSTEVKLFNDSDLSFWVPVVYKTTEGVRNHWIFVTGNSGLQIAVLQQTGKPLDFLIDPNHVSLALPFGWTRDGPPEELDGPANARSQDSLD